MSKTVRKSSEQKEEREIMVFKFFLEACGVNENLGTIRNELPPKPDISYLHPYEGTVAFELVEICSPEIPATISRLSKSTDQEPVFIRFGNTAKENIKSKLKKSRAGLYVTSLPIELLCFSGRTGSSDDMVINDVMPMLESQTIDFRRIWFLGERGVYLLYDGLNDKYSRERKYNL